MADSKFDQKPIIVKKVKAKKSHGGHGGTWKIAYADFITAMMAFFLLMWLLGSVTKGDLKGISDYFNNPLKVARNGGDGSGDATSIVKGGGNDISKKVGQINKKALEQNKVKVAALAEMKQKIEEMLQGKGGKQNSLFKFKDHLVIDMTPEGLRIQIIDNQGRPMFKSGSAQLEPYTIDIIKELALLLNDVPNNVSIAGHTDATPYSNDITKYSNWELSADRANATRREMVLAGYNNEKVLKVSGLGNAVPLKPEDVYNPQNRRITIVVLNDSAEQNIKLSYQ